MLLKGINLIIYVSLLLCISIEIIETTPIDKQFVKGKKSCKFDTIVVFGDSTCDNGNTWKKTNYTYPTKEYYKGRFSNGPTWVEYLSDLCNAKDENHAYGGATTDTSFVRATSGTFNNIDVPGIKQEINDEYLPKVKNTSVNFDKTLYTVIFQGNDYLNSKTVNPWDAVKNLYEQWVVLAKFGAKHILINSSFNFKYLPELAKTFGILKTLTPEVVSDTHNAAINNYTLRFRQEYKNVKLYIFPMNDIWEEMRSPSISKKLGLTDFSDPCVKKNQFNAVVSVCPNPEQRFYWDVFHPSNTIHRYIGHRAYDMLKE